MFSTLSTICCHYSALFLLLNLMLVPDPDVQPPAVYPPALHTCLQKPPSSLILFFSPYSSLFICYSLSGTSSRDEFFLSVSAVIYKWLSGVFFADVGHGVITELTKGLELIIDETLASGDCHLSTGSWEKLSILRKKASWDEVEMHRQEAKHLKNAGRGRGGDYFSVTA